MYLISGSLILARSHHVRLDVGGIVESGCRWLVLVEFVGVDPAPAIEGFVFRGHHAAGQEEDGNDQSRDEEGMPAERFTG